MIDEKRLIEEIDGKVAGLTNIQMMQIADIIASQQKVGECDRDCKDCWKTKFVNNAKPKEHADGWIPCSERLPNREEVVLLSVKFDEEPMILMGELWTSGWTLCCDGYDEEDFEFIAWMPLPSAYKGE